MSAAGAPGVSERRFRRRITVFERERGDTPSGRLDGKRPGGVPAVIESDADRAVTAMYETHYCSLVRLAALLTGDAWLAESLVQDAFVAMHGAWSHLRSPDVALPYLRQSVVSRSRWIRGPLALADGTQADGKLADGTQAQPSAVISAIRALPAQQREALVLRLYCDLPDRQVAAAMGVSQAAMQHAATSGLAALGGAR